MKLRPEQVEEMLREMFSRINVPYDEELVKKKDWFLTHSWSQAQYDRFQEWLIKYLMAKCRCTKKIAIKNSGWLMLSFAWTLKEPVPLEEE